MRKPLLLGAAWFAASALTAPASAADLGFMSSVALKAPLSLLLPAFEKATGHTVVAEFGGAAALKAKIDGGAPFCVAVLAAPAIDDLVKRGVVASDGHVGLAHIGAGLAFRTTSPKPVIASLDDLKATLLAAKSISVSDPALGGVSSAYFKTVVGQLGIADQLKAKTILTRPGEGAQPVAAGQADLGIVTMSEVATLKGIDAVPLFPSDPHTQAAFAAGVATGCADRKAADALIAYVRSADAAAIFREKRIEPD